MKRIPLFILGAFLGSLLMPSLLAWLVDAWASLAGTPVRCDGGMTMTPIPHYERWD